MSTALWMIICIPLAAIVFGCAWFVIDLVHIVHEARIDAMIREELDTLYREDEDTD